MGVRSQLFVFFWFGRFLVLSIIRSVASPEYGAHLREGPLPRRNQRERPAALRLEDCSAALRNIRSLGEASHNTVSGALQIHNCSAVWKGGSLGLGSVLLFCPWVVAINGNRRDDTCDLEMTLRQKTQVMQEVKFTLQSELIIEFITSSTGWGEPGAEVLEGGSTYN